MFTNVWSLGPMGGLIQRMQTVQVPDRADIQHRSNCLLQDRCGFLGTPCGNVDCQEERWDGVDGSNPGICGTLANVARAIRGANASSGNHDGCKRGFGRQGCPGPLVSRDVGHRPAQTSDHAPRGHKALREQEIHGRIWHPGTWAPANNGQNSVSLRAKERSSWTPGRHSGTVTLELAEEYLMLLVEFVSFIGFEINIEKCEDPVTQVKYRKVRLSTAKGVCTAWIDKEYIGHVLAHSAVSVGTVGAR
ncbi:hypothetical protein CYMTET_7418 [Cymbomonas tetramitiformis]|nr:hypothetical protein CYMTET_7418 [Cymbomonas tetramitiformis]